MVSVAEARGPPWQSGVAYRRRLTRTTRESIPVSLSDMEPMSLFFGGDSRPLDFIDG